VWPIRHPPSAINPPSTPSRRLLGGKHLKPHQTTLRSSALRHRHHQPSQRTSPHNTTSTTSTTSTARCRRISARQHAARSTQHPRPSPRRASCIRRAPSAHPLRAPRDNLSAQPTASRTGTVRRRTPHFWPIHCDCHACRTSNRPRHHAAHLAAQPTVSSASGQPARR
jgi:hypothetical protein